MIGLEVKFSDKTIKRRLQLISFIEICIRGKNNFESLQNNQLRYCWENLEKKYSTEIEILENKEQRIYNEQLAARTRALGINAEANVVIPQEFTAVGTHAGVSFKLNTNLKNNTQCLSIINQL